MKFSNPMKTLWSAILVSALSLLMLEASRAAPVVAKSNGDAPVKIMDNGATWTLDNGIIKATIDKDSGTIPSLVYHGTEIINDPKRAGRWEQYPSDQVTPSVTIDPTKNGGERGEVAVKGINSPMDLEVRYALERGVSGIYAYAEFSHEASYAETGLGESRYLFQMKPLFDWLSVDADRNMKMTGPADGVVCRLLAGRVLRITSACI
jgi:rhamnogalacturonan endolyase